MLPKAWFLIGQCIPFSTVHRLLLIGSGCTPCPDRGTCALPIVVNDTKTKRFLSFVSESQMTFFPDHFSKTDIKVNNRPWLFIPFEHFFLFLGYIIFLPSTYWNKGRLKCKPDVVNHSEDTGKINKYERGRRKRVKEGGGREWKGKVLPCLWPDCVNNGKRMPQRWDTARLWTFVWKTTQHRTAQPQSTPRVLYMYIYIFSFFIVVLWKYIRKQILSIIRELSWADCCLQLLFFSLA